MADLPEATVVIDDEAGAFADGNAYIIVASCVSKNADMKPRVFSSTAAILDQHDYSPGASYSAIHIDKTKKPVLFIGMPISVAGAVGRQNASGVFGTSAISIAAAASGILEETNGVVTVVDGGTIGVNGITFDISMDGNRTKRRVRLGVATSYPVPYFGIVVNFAAGTLLAGDVYTFSTTAPMWDTTAMDAARVALSKQQKLARSMLVCGDLPNSTYADAVVAAMNTYESSNDRYMYARVQVADRTPLASLSRTTVRMTGAPTLTFAEVGATGDTITRSSGSFITDGFAAGMFVTVTNSLLNNISGKITAVSATVLTLDTADVAAEVATAGCSIVGTPTLTFAEIGGTGDTITRSGGGSFLDDGFRAGDTVAILGTASNNVTGPITAATATVLTFGSTDLNPEVIGTAGVSIVKGQTMDAWVASQADAFASIAAQKRIDIGIGRLFKACPITGWQLRRPVAWAASAREYEHDVHIPTYRKADNPLDNWSLEDVEGTIVELDARSVAGALANQFTAARTYSNGPRGAYIALSLTRANEGSKLSRTHNLAVANVACSVTQAETENAIGQVLQTNEDGTGTTDSINRIEERVNSALQRELLEAGKEGPRASFAVWRANRTDKLDYVGAAMNGAVVLGFGATLEKINTRITIPTSG